MKKIAELLVCFLHPIAVVLVWLNVLVAGAQRHPEDRLGGPRAGARRAVRLRAHRRGAVGELEVPGGAVRPVGGGWGGGGGGGRGGGGGSGTRGWVRLPRAAATSAPPARSRSRSPCSGGCVPVPATVPRSAPVIEVLTAVAAAASGESAPASRGAVSGASRPRAATTRPRALTGIATDHTPAGAPGRSARARGEDRVELAADRRRVGDRPRRVAGGRPEHLLAQGGGPVGEQHLPDRGAVQRQVAAGGVAGRLGPGPREPLDDQGPAALEHRQVDGVARREDQVLEVGQRHLAQRRRRREQPEVPDPGADLVAPVGAAAEQARGAQLPDEAVRRPDGQRRTAARSRTASACGARRRRRRARTARGRSPTAPERS